MNWLFLIVILWLSQSNLLGQIVVSTSSVQNGRNSKIIKDSKDNLYRVNILTGKATYMGKTADNVLNRDNRIRDTLKLRQSIDDIYVNAKKELLINGEPVDGMLSKNTLIQGTDGEEYVYTGEEIMGKKEFLATGGNSRLMENYNKEKEEKAQPDVAFTASQQQKYGFDNYTEQKINIQNNYPELKTDYRPAFKSVESFTTDKVKTDAGQGITFRDEMGIPPTKTADELTFRGSTNGSITALYAYKKDNDTTETIAGKLNLLSFDKQNKKVYLVPVNGATLPDINALRNTLNKVYAQAITDWTVDALPNITVNFAGGQMTHGGSNAVSVYNADQKSIIKTFGDMEKDALYLFFVKNVQGKDGDIGGYMPLQRQAGFIYELPNNEIIAHELGHGAFNLRHTFSTEDNSFIAAQSTTENLMDYKGGLQLWKPQWEMMHNQSFHLGWFDEEGEAEYGIQIHNKLMYSSAIELGFSEGQAKHYAHYASTYADNPPVWIRVLMSISSATNLLRRDDVDYSKVDSSQNEKYSAWHGMMTDEEKQAGMTKDSAIKKGFEVGWNFVFQAIGNARNTTDVSDLAQGVHALQDVYAHLGMATNEHLPSSEKGKDGMSKSIVAALINDLTGNQYSEKGGKAYQITLTALILYGLAREDNQHIIDYLNSNTTILLCPYIEDEQRQKINALIHTTGIKKIPTIKEAPSIID